MTALDDLLNKTHIWTMALDVIANDAEAPVPDSIFDQLESLLSEQEIDRSKRFRFENNRREYIAAHALCRVMLSEFSDTPPRDWQFESGPHGRPEIVSDGNAGNLRFNISHTRGMVCVGVTRDHDIGVDVEWMGRNNALDEIAKAKFAKPELAQLHDLPGTEKRKKFFLFWTLKESYIKAIGKGLLEPLDGFAFSFEPLRIDFLNDQDDPQHWQFESIDLAGEYLCALAVKPGAETKPKVVHHIVDASGVVNY